MNIFYDGYDYEYEQEVLNELDIESVDTIDEENIGSILDRLSFKYKRELSGKVPVDLVLMAKVVNSEAHRERSELLFEIKCKLIEFALNTWGKFFPEDFGVRKDEKGRPVAYFDLPNKEQISFHLVYVDWDPRIVPEYTKEWKK